MGQVKTRETPENIKFEQQRTFIAPMVSDIWAVFTTEKAAIKFFRRMSIFVMGSKNPPRPHRSLTPMENLERYLTWQLASRICARYRSKADRAEVLRVLMLGIEWVYQDGRSPPVDWSAPRHRMAVNNGEET